MDEIQFAPPKKTWNDSIPLVNTKKPWLQLWSSLVSCLRSGTGATAAWLAAILRGQETELLRAALLWTGAESESNRAAGFGQVCNLQKGILHTRLLVWVGGN